MLRKSKYSRWSNFFIKRKSKYNESKELLTLFDMDRLCNILFTPLSGGNLVAQILSTHFYNNQTDIIEAYVQDKPWLEREQFDFKLHPSIYPQPTWTQADNKNFTFKDYANKRKNIVFISVADEHSRKGMRRRREYVQTTKTAANEDILELEMNYHTELESYLDNENLILYKVKFHDFFTKDDFTKTIKGLADCLNLDVSMMTIRHIYDAWRKANQIARKYRKRRPADWFDDKWGDETNRYGGIYNTK